MANRFVEAAEANEDIQLFRTHPVWARWWSPEVIADNPPVRVEFEHVIVLGTVSAALNLAKHKSGWGELVKIRPLLPDDPLDPVCVVHLYKETNLAHQNYERRQHLKHQLGTAKKLVTRARKLSKARFLKSLTDKERSAIRSKLGIAEEDFWQACRRGGAWQGVLPL